MTYPKFHLQIESYLRTVKAIKTGSNITTYSLVVLTSAYELEGLCELQRQLCSAHMLVQTAYYRSVDPPSGTFVVHVLHFQTIKIMSNTSGSLLKQVLIPFLIAVLNKTYIKKEQDNLFTGANMYEELISSLSTENDLVLSCGKEKSELYLQALNMYMYQLW